MFHRIPHRDEDDDEELCGSSPSSGDSDDEDSPLTDFREEAASPNSPRPLAKTTSLPSQFDAKGPLYDLSSLISQLPVKRGLSKYYEGKSQSYSSLSDVRCLEDLPKKERPYNRRKMKSGKSCGGGPDGSPTSTHATGTCSKTISKKASSGSCAAAASVARSGSKPPSIPTQKNLCLR